MVSGPEKEPSCFLEGERGEEEREKEKKEEKKKMRTMRRMRRMGMMKKKKAAFLFTLYDQARHPTTPRHGEGCDKRATHDTDFEQQACVS